MSAAGDALIIGLGSAAAPAVADRLAADGYRVVTLREADEPEDAFRDVATLLDRRVPGFRPDAVVIAACAPEAGGVDAIAVATLMSALDATLATAGMVAKSLFAAGTTPRARAVVMLDWAATSTPGRTAASAVMGGLLGLARSWSLEFAPLGITTNAVVVGPDGGGDGAGDPAEEAWLVRRPTPADAAHAAAFFLDARSSAITGQVLLVCGGRTAGRLTI